MTFRFHDTDPHARGTDGCSTKVVVDPHGAGYVSIGVARSRRQRIHALVIVRFSERGDILGEIEIVPPGGDVVFIHSVATDNQGAVLVAGENKDGSSFLIRAYPNRDVVDAKYAANFRSWLDQVRARGQVVEARALLPQQSGKLVVAGSVYERIGLQSRGPFVIRLNVDGTVDQGFRKYGGPPKSGFEFEMTFAALGERIDGCLVASGRIAEIDGYSAGCVVYLDPLGQPIPSAASAQLSLSTVFSEITCTAFDPTTGGLVLGGKRTLGSGDSQACVSRMLRDGQIDSSASGGGTWSSTTGRACIRAVALTKSGSIVAVGSNGDYPAMFLCNPDGLPVATFGEAGMKNIGAGGSATDVCMSGNRVVVNLERPGKGFILKQYQLEARMAEIPEVRSAPPFRRSVSSPTRAQASPPPSVAPARARGRLQSAASLQAQRDALNNIAQSQANMSASRFMMGIHSMNMSTQRF